VALTDPLQRLGMLGRQLALAPLQVSSDVLAVLAAPVRRTVRHEVRRSIGLPGRPVEVTRDPDLAFLQPDAVARRVHGDLPAMLIGGLSALLLQALHPLVMAGVADHSNYANDPVGRLRRTAAFVGYTTFGTDEDAHRAIRQVQRIHRQVHGITPDGRAYAAEDPELVTWVHVAEVSSFLRASLRFGSHHLSDAECDDYFAETAAVAYELGAQWVPRSTDEVEAYFRRVRPGLYAGPQARAARDFLLRGIGTRPEDRMVHGVAAAAAVSLLPGWARSELGIPAPPLVDTVIVVPLARILCDGLRWAVTGDESPSSPPTPDQAPARPDRGPTGRHRAGRSSARRPVPFSGAPDPLAYRPCST